MTIIRWNTAPNAAEMLSNMIERNIALNNQNCNVRPAYNILDKNNAWEIQLAIPGISKEAVKIEVKNNMLVVSYENEKQVDDTETFIRKEFSVKAFSKSFSIPKEANPEKIEASYKNGILSIVIPRHDADKLNLLKNISIN
ncbi:MAG: Hsp20/alpha crystallin family protein [Clostridiaceae bacterium]|nr:Hsp20/alpha crystallin family protein [Clostridiaceae bacterium]